MVRLSGKLRSFHLARHTGIKSRRRISYSTILGILLISVIISAGIFTYFGSKAQQNYLFQNSTVTLKDNWSTKDGASHSLPLKLNGDAFFSYETILSQQEGIDRPVLMFEGKYMNTSIYFNDVLVGSYECKADNARHTSGKTVSFVSLPDYYDGLRVRMEGITLLGENVTYEMIAPVLGNQAQIFFDVLMSELFELILTIVIISIGFFLLLFSLQARCTHNGASYFYTSLFSILYSFYYIFTSQTIYFICPNSGLIYYGEFISLALLPLPLLILLYYKTNNIYKKIIALNISLVTVHFILIILLHFFTKSEFRNTLISSHMMMILSLIVIVFSILFGFPSREERQKLLITFSPIFFGTIGSLTLFYLPSVSKQSLLFILCVLIFLIMQAYELIRTYFDVWKENIQSALYQHLAYTDALTQVQNRTAFEEKILQLTDSIKNDTLTSLWCICADVNGLKIVNDTLGHEKGDQLLCLAANSLNEILFGESYLYRTGGDEFILFLLNCTETELKDALCKLQAIILKNNSHSTLKLSIALGYDCLQNFETDTIGNMLQRADTYMYENKRKMKSYTVELK